MQKMETKQDFLQKGRQNFYKIMERQNILWNLIDSKIVEEDSEVHKPLKTRKKKNPQIQLETN